jgi:hypothetical protein
VLDRRRICSRRRKAGSFLPSPAHCVCSRTPRKLPGLDHCNRSPAHVVPLACERASSQRHSLVGCAYYAAGWQRFALSFMFLVSKFSFLARLRRDLFLQLTWPPLLSGAPELSSSIAPPCINGKPFAPPLFTLDCPSTQCCHATNRLQAAILLFAVEQGVPAAVNGGADAFARAYALPPYGGSVPKGSGIISGDVRSAALQAGVMSFGRPAFSAVLAEYRIIQSAAEKARLLAAAASATNLVLLQELLEASLDVNVVRVQDTISTISAVAANPTPGAISAAWSFVKRNWPTLVLRYKGINFAMDNLLSSFKAFSQTDDVEDLRSFIAKNSADLDSAVAAQTLETASSNAAWVEAHAREVKNWVYPPPASPGSAPSPPDAGHNGAQSSAEAIALVVAVCAVIAFTMLAFKLKRHATYARQNDV